MTAKAEAEATWYCKRNPYYKYSVQYSELVTCDGPVGLNYYRTYVHIIIICNMQQDPGFPVEL